MAAWTFYFALEYSTAELSCDRFEAAREMAAAVRRAGLADITRVVPPVTKEGVRQVVASFPRLTARGIWQELSCGFARDAFGRVRNATDPAVYQIAAELRREGWNIPTVWGTHQKFKEEIA